ncbi:FeoB-associated Cys-rich membrane protein [Caproiciproducens sp. LBM24188]|nr:FeoB-associated Cys-rich membrane protein [Oscillospiraceae bacterium]HHV32856.1 FeoB-associated Cys-rich membrane protein [Clostridiales bacterium]
MGLSDYLILAGVLVLAILAVRYAFRRRKRCCGDCSACTQHSSCTTEEKTESHDENPPAP